MSTLNWIPPLPPGVEARWDGNQRAYFYIDHNTKQTSWIDPRPDYYAKQPKDHPPPNPKHSSAGEPVFGFRGSGNVPKKETTFLEHDDVKVKMLQDMFPDVPESTCRVVLKIKNNNIQEARAHLIKGGNICKTETDHSSAAQLQIDNIVKKLQKAYPLARNDVIKDIVVGCNNNEKNARQQLESMGYKPVGSTTKSQSRSRSPSPKPQKISDAEKQRMLGRMKSQFSDVGDTFINMALEAANYDESKCRRMIEHHKQGKHGSASASGRKTVDDELTFKPSSSLVPETFSGGMEPVIFEHDTPSSTVVPFSTETKSQSKTTSPTKTITSPTKKTTERDRRTPSPTHSRETTPSKSRQTNSKVHVHTSQQRETIDQHASRLRLQQSRPSSSKQTTSPAHTRQQRQTIEQHAARLEAQKKQANRVKKVTVVEPTRVIETQPRSYLAKGPDPSIRRGPDKNLLLEDYVVTYGPNPEICEGPDRSRVHGSMGAVGPDPSLVCGPQAIHVH